ncbi:Cysteine proteinase [Coniochaeta hoffmannii]|uniref:Cysteine proteinase n=1 Tax=Coniochaeta hoffmannii TaxID=91930 RepID=A0AA38R2S7_9PEZI|nr:Cysteine proteinase [Coniochaeta hoffmannii]
MSQRAATPRRTTRNSRGLRETTPTDGRSPRESSVTSDDDLQLTSTPLRRSQRLRKSSVTSDDGNRPAPTPARRTRTSRESSVASDDDDRSAPTIRNFQRAQAVPVLTPIKEESPTPTPARFKTPAFDESLTPFAARFNTPYAGGLESTFAAAEIESPAIEQTPTQTSADGVPEPSPVHIANVEQRIAQPSPTETALAEQSATTATRSPTALVASPTTASTNPAARASPTAVVASLTAPALSTRERLNPRIVSSLAPWENDRSPAPLHKVGLGFTLQPVSPLQYYFGITDDELQDLIRKDQCDEPEVDEPDRAWIQVRRERTKARRQYKLQRRYDQLRRTFKLPEYFSEQTHSIITGEDPGQYTETYGSFKHEEGHAFGARLLQAIKDDHERRGCECPLPQVYQSRAEAEAGQGTFRFFRFQVPGSFNIWVFMRKDDWHWHCTCDNKALSDFALWVRKHKAEKRAQIDSAEQLLREEREETAKRLSRKRKAQDDEAELVEPVATRLVDGPLLRGAAAVRRKTAHLKSTRLVRSVRAAGVSLASQTVQSMGGVFSTAAIIMGTSVKHFLSKVGAQLSTVWNTKQAQTAIERRTQDENGHLVVKRLKSQHYVPVTTAKDQAAWDAAKQSAVPSPFDEYAWFEWTDDPKKYVGEWYLKRFKILGDNVYRELVSGKYHFDVSEDAIREHNRRTYYQVKAGLMKRDQEYDVELSLRLHRHAMDRNRVDDVENPTDVKHNRAGDEPAHAKGKYKLPKYHMDRIRISWEEGSAAVSQMIEGLYYDKNLIPRLKEKFGPKPPKDLSKFTSKDFAEQARKARNYMVRFLQDEPALDDGMKLAITRFIADMDAIHKLDIPYSLVEFPGKADEKVLPGSWPLDLLEDVPIEGLYIRPIHELQAPERQSPNGTGESPRGDLAPFVGDLPPAVPWVPSRSILKDPSEVPLKRHPMPGDKPKLPTGPTIRFSEELRSFRSPRHRPYRLTVPEPEDAKGKKVDEKKGPRALKEKKLTEKKGAVVRKEKNAIEKKEPDVPRETKKLWNMYLTDVFSGHVKRPRQLFNQQPPLGRPEDQTMDEAGISKMENHITGEEYLEAPPPTKYEKFLQRTREEIFEGGWNIGPTRKKPPPFFDDTVPRYFARVQESHNGGMVDKLSPSKVVQRDTKKSPYRPIRAAQLGSPPPPSPKKSIEQIMAERDLVLNDRSGDLFPDADLQIATKKLEDLNIARQVREEEQAAAERARAELARLKEEERRRREAEERRKAEEERRRREEQERRAAEQARRRQEVEAARLREEERRVEEEHRRMALGLRRPTRAIITRLNDPWASRVAGIRGSQEGQPLATTPDGTALTKRDFLEKLLPETAWLNDNIIIGAIQHIGDLVNEKAGGTKENPKCATFTSYFYPRLESAGPTGVARLMRRAGVRKDNFKNIQSILIPICSGAHWTLAVVLPQKGAVLHMDSLRGGRGHPAVTNKIMEWVKVTLGEDFVPSEWSAINIDGPMQTNGYDCGVFTITNGLCMALGLNPKESYAPSQLTTARTMLAAILLNGGFKGQFDLAGV